MPRALAWGTILSALLVLVPPILGADSDQDASGPAPGESTAVVADVPLGHLQKDDKEWGLLAGAGAAHDFGGVGDRQYLSVGGRLGRVLTNPIGPGFLKGNFEVAVEILPVFLMFQEQATYGFSSSLLFRHYLAPNSKLKPLVSLGAGALFSTDPIPPETSGVNFTPQAGIGILWFPKAGLAYLLEYRLVHISSGGLKTPNPGINSSYFQFGVSIFR
jgi:hypothetical protein